MQNENLKMTRSDRKKPDEIDTTAKTIVQYYQRFYRGEIKHDGFEEDESYTRYSEGKWVKIKWRPLRPLIDASNRRQVIEEGVDQDDFDKAKSKLFLIQGDPEIMVKCHDRLAEELGNPEELKLTSTGAIHKLGALHALIKTINRLELEQWSGDGTGFDFVILDMNPHPTFFNLLGMRRYAKFPCAVNERGRLHRLLTHLTHTTVPI